MKLKLLFLVLLLFILCLSTPSSAVEQRIGAGVGYSWPAFYAYGRPYTRVFALQTGIDYRVIIARHFHFGLDLAYYRARNDQVDRDFYDILQLPHAALSVGFSVRQANLIEECLSVGVGLGVWVGSSHSNDNAIGVSDAVPAGIVFGKAEVNLLLLDRLAVGPYVKIDRMSQLGTQNVTAGVAVRIRFVNN